MSGTVIHERLLSYESSLARVRSTSGSLLEWLDEFLAPWFETPRNGRATGAVSIEVRVSASELETWMRQAGPTGRSSPCFTLDQSQVRWPVMRGPDGSERAVDPALGVALDVLEDEGAKTVRIVTLDERPAARLTALRVLREIASAHAIERGFLPMHSAAVAVDGRVTLIVGPKRSGKSSLLLHAVAGHGARYVANDRVMVDTSEPRPRARGMPSIVGIREGSLDLVEGLGDELWSRSWHYSATVAEARAHRLAGTFAEGAGASSPPGVGPAQLCAILGTEPLAGGPIQRIVFPTVGEPWGGQDRFDLRELSVDEAAARLLEVGILGGGRSVNLLAGTTTEAPPLGQPARRLAAAVRSFACTLGPGAYRDPSVWRAIQSERDS